MSSVRFRDQVAGWSIDLQWGIDYPTNREDIDPTRIAGLAVSVNHRKLALLALEKRHRSLVLLSAGAIRSFGNMIPETNGLYYAPFIEAPKLRVHGRYDDVDQLPGRSGAALRLTARAQGAVPLRSRSHSPIEVSVPVISRWLDRTLGPVQE